jgi:hypothetical protein
MRTHSLLRTIAALAIAAACIVPVEAKTEKPTPPPTRTAINTCDQAWLFMWPNDSALPVRAHFAPAHAGEQFELLGTDKYTLEGRGYYETTIPVISGSPAEAHYWISDACVNPLPLRSPAPNPAPSSRT